MKYKILLLLVLAITAQAHSQNYMLTFTGIGASTTVDSVNVENLMQCKDIMLMGTDVLNLSATASINELSEESPTQLNIFPNPTEGSCYASFTAPTNGNTTIEIFDALGKSIAKTEKFISKGQHTFNIQGMGSGVFLLKIKSEKYDCNATIISQSESIGNITISETNSTINLTASGKIKPGKNTLAMNYQTGDRL